MAVRRYLPLVLTVVFVLVAAAVIVPRIVGRGGGTPAAGPLGSDGPRVGCVASVPVVVASSTEKYGLLSELAHRYNGAPGACASITVTRVNSGDAAQSLATTWDTGVRGPFPDVWVPAASAWIGVAQGARGDGVVPGSGPSIASTPLVIAMPRPKAEALGWPVRTLSWSDLVALAADPATWARLGRDWGPFTLGKTNPTESTSGLFALLAALSATPGLSGDLEGKVRSPQGEAFERTLEGGVVHYGNTELEFLENLYRAGQTGGGLNYVSAVAIEEKSVWDYNQGNPSGDPGTLGQAPRPAVPLVAFTPAGGTLMSDSPYLVLNTVDDAKRRGADDFRRWLREPSQQAQFRAKGFRDADRRSGPALGPADGFPPGTDSGVAALPAPSREAVAGALALWPRVRKPANVTLVMDRSGSMGPPPTGRLVPETGHTRWEDAKAAAGQSFARLGGNDRLSLWTFSSPDPGDPHPYRIEVGSGPAAPARDAMRARLDAIAPSGGTALYETTQAAVDQVRTTYDPGRINAVVVLTDGHNEDTPQLDPGPLMADLPEGPGRPPVRVFSVAYGGESDLDALSTIGQATGGYVYNAQDPSTIGQVFDDVVSNF